MADWARDGTPLRVELGLGEGGAWVDVSDRLHDQEVQIARGRSDEASRVQPTSVSFELDNPDGWLTPGHPGSPYYPRVRRGVPVRVSILGRAPSLVLPGDP